MASRCPLFLHDSSICDLCSTLLPRFLKPVGRRNGNEWNAATIVSERASARVCGRAYSRGISVAASPAKESFAPFLVPVFFSSFIPSLYLSRRPLTAIPVLPSWRSFFCRSTIITRDFSRFRPPLDRYPATQ